MAKSIIPTLFLNSPVLENANDKLIYILKFMFYSPGWISSWYDNHLLSMRKFMATYTEDSGTLVPALQQYINTVINKFYTDYSCHIDVVRDEDNPANYSMVINIIDAAGNNIITLDKIRKDENNLFVFEGTKK